MIKRLKNTFAAVLAAALATSLLAGCGDTKTEASPSPAAPPAGAEEPASPSASASPEVQTTKAQIEAKLAEDRANLLGVTWADDDSAVAYLRSGADGANICVWRVGELNEKTVRKVSGAFNGLRWSPDGAYFLIITGRSGSTTTTSSIISAETLKQLGDDVESASVSPPVWSPDSKYLALPTEIQTEDGKTTVKLDIYALASKQSVTVATQENAQGPFIVEYWKDETIGYTTLTASGERAEQTVQIGE